MPDLYSMAAIAQWQGHDFGVSDWFAVSQDIIDTFADATGDHQWIHVDAARCAKESPFGAPIAHGFLTLALLAKFVQDLGITPPDCAQVINAGVNNVRFQEPVKTGQEVRARVRIDSVQEKRGGRLLVVAGCVLEIRDADKPALEGEITMMMFPQEPADG